ncbi:MAG: hypothetical protein PHT94_00560 [Candidatus Nanoarchaeia archaeon]|nr:hypothetical protein [Candidatus Nanoarchaeia archaeon]
MVASYDDVGNLKSILKEIEEKLKGEIYSSSKYINLTTIYLILKKAKNQNNGTVKYSEIKKKSIIEISDLEDALFIQLSLISDQYKGYISIGGNKSAVINDLKKLISLIEKEL